MFSVTLTYILYDSLLLLCPILCSHYDIVGHTVNKQWTNNREKRNINYAILGYLILFIVLAFRYDIGADYENYAEGILDLVGLYNSNYSLMEVLSDFNKEPAIPLLSYLFRGLDYPHLWVLGIMSLGYIILIFKVFDNYKIHGLGVFVLIISYVYFQSMDWVRQSMSFVIFLYSFRHLENGNFWKYFLGICCAGLFHYTSLFLLLLYFLRNIKIGVNYLSLITFSVFILAELGILDTFHDLLQMLVVFYNDGYATSDHMIFGTGTYHTTTFILTMLWYQIWLYLSKYVHLPYLSLFFFIGIILYAISGGNLLVDRIAYYFTSLQIIIIPLVYRKISLDKAKKFVMIFVFVMQFVIFNYVYIGAGFRGCVPYESILSTNCENTQFRFRDY